MPLSITINVTADDVHEQHRLGGVLISIGASLQEETGVFEDAPAPAPVSNVVGFPTAATEPRRGRPRKAATEEKVTEAVAAINKAEASQDAQANSTKEVTEAVKEAKQDIAATVAKLDKPVDDGSSIIPAQSQDLQIPVVDKSAEPPPPTAAAVSGSPEADALRAKIRTYIGQAQAAGKSPLALQIFRVHGADGLKSTKDEHLSQVAAAFEELLQS